MAGIGRGVNCSLQMAFSWFVGLISLIAINNCAAQFKHSPLETFDMLYNAGIESYAGEQWMECADYIQRAIQDYKLFQGKLIDCRLKCESNRKTIPSYLDYMDLNARNTLTELAFFETAITRSDCIRRCKKQTMAGRPDSVNSDIMFEFENLQPYDYLQICSYKDGDLNMAAAASFTFLLANPQHQTMKTNVQFYRTLNVKDEFFYNMELKKHKELYMKGVETYGAGQFVSTINHIEEALTEYYSELQGCSLLCEGTYDHESLPEFYNAIADHWISVLRCKQQCLVKLSTINGAVVDNYLVEHYNYLQFSYYQEKKMKDAASCAATYLLMRPDDETMIQNKQFYLTMDELNEDHFIYRSDALLYMDSQKLERQMLDFVEKRYKFSDADEDDGRDERKPQAVFPFQPSVVFDPDKFRNPDYFSEERRDAEGFGKRDDENFAHFKRLVEESGATIHAREEEMMGTDRFTLDGLLTDEQCGIINDLAKYGFGGRKLGSLSPKIKYEVYDGIKVPGIRSLFENRTIDLSMADLFFKTTDKMRALVSSYYNIQWPLYIDFVHAACKNPVVDADGETRDDFYQRVHADNCNMNLREKTCIRQEPARYWREFTVIMYLNELEEGGEFIFADDSMSVMHKVAPKCGRMVAFNSSHLHGVSAYKGSKRCTIGLWTTVDPSWADRDIDQAKASINVMRAVDDNPVLKEFIEEKKVTINMTKEELNGENRFAMDNVMTEEECDSLIHLANIGGVAGDGYNHGRLTSVDTVNEQFAGLTVAKAAELAAEGKLEVDWVKLYLDKANLVKDVTEKYFKLDSPLYFDYTHLVCRTSLHDKDKLRTDLSHPIHSDNCIIQNDNSCQKRPPAYTQRDYSALLYLNENFTGGEFMFTHENMTIQSMVRPRCGMAVAFDAGIYHGVHAVTSGQRCALAVWFTLDKNFDEAAHGEARKILQDLEGKPQGPPLHSHHGGEL